MNGSNDMDSSAGALGSGSPRVLQPLRRLWISWLLGAAVLAAVVAVALHRSEAEAFARLLEQVEPGWFALAVVLQALTYLAQGQLYRRVARAGGADLPLLRACKLGLIL